MYLTPPPPPRSCKKFEKVKSQLLLIDHYIATSAIHGLGAFAAEAAMKGSIIWRFDPVIDQIIPENVLANLPAHAVRNIMMRAAFDPKQKHYVIGLDGDAFMNHSENANLKYCGDHAIATKDISIGDELTWNYREMQVAAFNPDLQDFVEGI